MSSVMKIIRTIDTLSRYQGYVLAVVLLALVFFVVLEVVLRYIFNSPTIWGTEFQLFMYGALFMLSQAYTLYRGTHARVDVLLTMLPTRVQHIISAIGYGIFFIPFAVVIFWYGVNFAYGSWMEREISVWSGWAPPIYPIKAIIPLGALMLGIQGLAELARLITVIATGDTTNE